MPTTPCLSQKPKNCCCYGLVSRLWTLQTPVFMARKRWRHDGTMSSEYSQGYLWIPCEFYTSLANQIMCNKQSALEFIFLDLSQDHIISIVFPIIIAVDWNVCAQDTMCTVANVTEDCSCESHQTATCVNDHCHCHHNLCTQDSDCDCSSTGLVGMCHGNHGHDGHCNCHHPH